MAVCKLVAGIVGLFALIVGLKAILFAMIVGRKVSLFASPRQLVCEPLQLPAPRGPA